MSIMGLGEDFTGLGLVQNFNVGLSFEKNCPNANSGYLVI